MAHELRELGRYDEMIQTYRRLVQEHPKSELVLDAYLVLGDHAFDESDLAGAESWYRRVLEAPISPAHDIAHFKMGWVELNRQSFPRLLRPLGGLQYSSSRICAWKKATRQSHLPRRRIPFGSLLAARLLKAEVVVQV